VAPNTGPVAEPQTTLPPVTTTTIGTSNLSGPGLQFFNAVASQIPAIAADVADDIYVVQDGQQLCSTLAVESESPGTPYDGAVEGGTLGETGFGDLSTTQAQNYVSDAIEYLCPSELSLIPAGDPGAQ
jgi:hypothetical protein